MKEINFKILKNLAKVIRYFILVSTTQSGSDHPTSSLSATELMTTLLFGRFFRFDPENPDYPANDRLIFSKGHASALFYSLWAAAGRVSEEELLTLRRFGSPLEGHPAMVFPYTEAATGSLGQGLSIGLGMALNAKIDELPYQTFVLLGDSEMTEGSQWEAIQVAAYYKLDNLIGILDINRLGQTGQTMYGHDLKAYEKRISSFGWKTIMIKDGHYFPEIVKAYTSVLKTKEKPTMIIAKTIKGKGVKFLENKNGWHGKVLSKEEAIQAIKDLGEIDKSIHGEIARPLRIRNPATGEARQRRQKSEIRTADQKLKRISYPKGTVMATRKAYGRALIRIFPQFPEMVVLDAEVSNSTYSEIFKKKYPKRFFEMYIAEQNMAGAALGLSRRGKIPFVSTFAAFWTRAFDQIRMSQYSDSNIKFVGSHAGVSIGEDGPSQMGLEDLAMFRTFLNSVVLYPSDAVSCDKLVEEAAKHRGNVYIRTTRIDTPIIYESDEEFPIGGSKTLKEDSDDKVTLMAAGVTIHEALKAYEELAKIGIKIRVIDLYSIKPLDKPTIQKAACETKAIITVEDHFAEGGIGEAVRSSLKNIEIKVSSLAVRKLPKSGKPSELLNYEEISAKAIVKKVKELISV